RGSSLPSQKRIANARLPSDRASRCSTSGARMSAACVGEDTAPSLYAARVQLAWLMIQMVNDSRALANDLPPVLLRLARRLRRESHAFGVTGGQASLLASIKERPGVTARELAEREHVSAPGISAQLDALERLGLIRRERAADRRRVGLFLEPEGRRVLQ